MTSQPESEPQATNDAPGREPASCHNPVQATAFRALSYGYLRTDLLETDEVKQWDDRLAEFAEAHGYQLATVFHEPSPQTTTVPPAFVELVAACRRSEAHTVLTVHGHMSGLAVPRMCLLDLLAARGHAHAWDVPA